MTFNHLDDIPARTVFPGFHGKFIHTDQVTIAFWTVDAGATLPDHAHPHEQITTGIEGTFEMTINGETQTVLPGDVAVIPGGVTHAGRAITACRLVDVFCPPRDDYR